MAQTFIVKGDVVSNPTTNDFGKAHFVRITATSDVTGSVFESDGTTQLGQFYLENGDTIIVEKKVSKTKLLVALQNVIRGSQG